jgi:hypothetical protein
MLLLFAAGCLAAPLGDSATALPEELVSWSSLGSSTQMASSASMQAVAQFPKRPVPASGWKSDLDRQERPSLAAPLLGVAVGAGVVALGMFCAGSSTVQDAFRTKSSDGQNAAAVTGAGIMLGGAVIISVSVVHLGKAL